MCMKVISLAHDKKTKKQNTAEMIQCWADGSEQESVDLPEMLLNLLRCRGFQGVVKGYLKVLLASAQEAVLSLITEATVPKTCPSESNAFLRHPQMPQIFQKQKGTVYPLLLCLLLNHT